MTRDDATPIRRGPKPKPANERRTCTKLIRWSPDELEILEARAEAAGVPVAVFVRLSSLGERQTPKP